MRSLLLLFCLFSVVIGKAITAADKDAVSAKINEITDKIFTDIALKKNLTSSAKDDLKATVDGAIAALREKIQKQNEEKLSAVAEPKGLFTDYVEKKKADKDAELQKALEAFEAIKQTLEEKKQQKQEQVEKFLNDLKESYGVSSSEKAPAVQQQANGFLTDLKAKKAAKDAEKQAKIDDFLPYFESIKGQFEEKKTSKKQEIQEQFDAVLTKLNELKTEHDAQKEVVVAAPKGILTDLQAKKAEKDAAKKAKVDELLAQFAELKENFKTKKDEKAEQQEEFLNSIFEKLQERQAEKEKEAAIVPAAKGLIADLSNSAAAKKEEERLQKVAVLEGIVGIADQLITEVKARDAAKEQQKQELIDQVTPYMSQINEELKTKLAEVKEQKKTDLKQKWEDIKVVLTNLKTKLDAKKADKKLERQAKWDQLKAKINEFIAPSPAAAAAPVDVAAKATFLDEITGTSAWQTVTWILLAICILLSLALVGTIFYQVSQHSKYERLSGHDDGEFPPAARSSSAYGRTPEVGPSAPSAYPTKQIQQF